MATLYIDEMEMGRDVELMHDWTLDEGTTLYEGEILEVIHWEDNNEFDEGDDEYDSQYFDVEVETDCGINFWLESSSLCWAVPGSRNMVDEKDYEKWGT